MGRGGKTTRDAVAAETRETEEVPVTLSSEEMYLLYVAMLAMVDDIHTPQDSMTNDQWSAARALIGRFNPQTGQIE